MKSTLLQLTGLIALVGGILYTTEAILSQNYFRACVAFLCYAVSYLFIVQPRVLE